MENLRQAFLIKDRKDDDYLIDWSMDQFIVKSNVSQDIHKGIRFEESADALQVCDLLNKFDIYAYIVIPIYVRENKKIKLGGFMDILKLRFKRVVELGFDLFLLTVFVAVLLASLAGLAYLAIPAIDLNWNNQEWFALGTMFLMTVFLLIVYYVLFNTIFQNAKKIFDTNSKSYNKSMKTALTSRKHKTQKSSKDKNLTKEERKILKQAEKEAKKEEKRQLEIKRQEEVLAKMRGIPGAEAEEAKDVKGVEKTTQPSTKNQNQSKNQNEKNQSKNARKKQNRNK